MTFLTAGTLRMPRGNLGDFLDWWVVLRSLIDGRPVHTRGAVDFRGPRRLAARPPPLVHARRRRRRDRSTSSARPASCTCAAGSTPTTMNEISADMDRALPTYVRDDGRSWWAKTANGDDRCVRMEYFHEHSERVRELLASERFLRIGRLVEGDYVAAHRRQPHRSAREADRRRRGHLRRAVAQGLLARHALLPMLRPHRAASR